MANVLTLITGTVIVQIITVAISSILTRLFSPFAFGVFVVYLPIAWRAAPHFSNCGHLFIIFGSMRTISKHRRINHAPRVKG
jgi:hypothetical protein